MSLRNNFLKIFEDIFRIIEPVKVFSRKLPKLSRKVLKLKGTHESLPIAWELKQKIKKQPCKKCVFSSVFMKILFLKPNPCLHKPKSAITALLSPFRLL